MSFDLGRGVKSCESVVKLGLAPSQLGTGGRGGSHLKGLKGEADVVALSDGDLPHTHFVGPVVVRVVRGLNLAIVPFHLPTADGCMRQ